MSLIRSRKTWFPSTCCMLCTRTIPLLFLIFKKKNVMCFIQCVGGPSVWVSLCRFCNESKLFIKFQSQPNVNNAYWANKPAEWKRCSVYFTSCYNHVKPTIPVSLDILHIYNMYLCELLFWKSAAISPWLVSHYHVLYHATVGPRQYHLKCCYLIG